MVFSLCPYRISVQSKKSLLSLKERIGPDDHVMQRERALITFDAIGSVPFWQKLGLVSVVLRPPTIEIGLIPRRGTCSADVIVSFGRVWACMEGLKGVMYRRSALVSSPD